MHERQQISPWSLCFVAFLKVNPRTFCCPRKSGFIIGQTHFKLEFSHTVSLESFSKKTVALVSAEPP